MINKQLKQTFNFYVNNTNKEQLARKVNDLALEIKYNKNVKSEVYSSLIIQSLKQCYKIINKNNHLAKDDSTIISVFEEALVEAIEKWDENRSQFITFLYMHFSRKVNSQIVAQRRVWKRAESLVENDFFNFSFKDYKESDITVKHLIESLKLKKQEKRYIWFTYLGYSFNEIKKELKISTWKFYDIKQRLRSQLNILDFV